MVHANEERELSLLRRGLGTLWLVDAALQAQPRLFGNGMVRGIMGPALVGQPPWLEHVLRIGIHLWGLTPVGLNLGAVLIQLGIGLFLWSGRSRWDRLVLAGSAAWILGVWVVGEGLGGILLPGPSLLTGAPGSALLYLVPTGLLLGQALRTDPCQVRPSGSEGSAAPTTTVVLRLCLSAVFVLGAVWQGTGKFWQATALARVGRSSLSVPQPLWLADSLRVAAHTLSSGGAGADVTVNLGLVALFLALAVWWLRPNRSQARLFLTLGTLALLWWFGMDLGVFGGVATDPNTPPILGLWALAATLTATPALPALRGRALRPWPPAARLESVAGVVPGPVQVAAQSTGSK